MAAGLTGCAVETSLTEKTVKTEDSNAVESVPTYATFSWAIDDANFPTKSGGTMENDGGATAEGKKITDFRLLVFNAGDTCEINRAWFFGSSSAKTQVTLRITSGQKKVFVIANTRNSPLEAALNTITSGTFQQFCTMMYDLNLNTATDASASLAVPNHIDGLTHLINPSTGFVMSNRIDMASQVILNPGVDSVTSWTPSGNINDISNPTNHFTIRVQRAVAKVGLRLASADVLNSVSGGRLVSPKFVLRNVNRALYPFQRFRYSNEMTSPDSAPVVPYYSDNQSTDEDTLALHYFNYTDWEPLGTTIAKSYYVTENTHADPTLGNTTYAAVEAVFLPNAGTVVTDADYNPLNGMFAATCNATDMTAAPAVLYRLRMPIYNYSDYGLPSTAFFIDRNLAYRVAYIIRTGSESGWNVASMESLISAHSLGDLIEEYPGGRCYYCAHIGRKGNSQSGTHIYRNYAFTVTVSSFVNIGTSRLENYLSSTPIGGETYLTTEIEMEDWNSYDSETVLDY
jgi:hypothetical protein